MLGTQLRLTNPEERSCLISRLYEIYAAFGRGDVPAILAKLADSVQWEYGAKTNEVPWLQQRHGKKEVAGFFESLGALEFHAFVPKTFLEGPGVVAHWWIST